MEKQITLQTPQRNAVRKLAPYTKPNEDPERGILPSPVTALAAAAEAENFAIQIIACGT
jgi:hypothetical protein